MAAHEPEEPTEPGKAVYDENKGGKKPLIPEENLRTLFRLPQEHQYQVRVFFQTAEGTKTF